MIYRINKWNYGNSSTGALCDLTFSFPRVSSSREPAEKRRHPLELRNRSSILRAKRMIKHYGLSNDWDYFCTFTFDQKKLDRIKISDPVTGQRIPLTRSDHKYLPLVFTQWIRDQRKKHNSSFSYLLIPEIHKDLHNWHIHGLMSGFPPDLLLPHSHPECHFKGYLEWPALSKKFGFSSFSKVRSGEGCVYYCLKYVNKDLYSTRMNDGISLYYPSRDLVKPVQDSESLYMDLSDEWIRSNVMVGAFGNGYARGIPSEVCEDLISSMQFHRLCQVYGFEDLRRMSDDDILSVLDLMDQQQPSPYSDYIFDLFGNRKDV